jgi:predicted ATP-dependent serine protease
VAETNPALCTCGADRAQLHTAWVCSHCDEPCHIKGNGCPACNRYGAFTNHRVAGEHELERRQRGS